MVHFRQRGFWGPVPILVVAGTVGVPVYVHWGEPLSWWVAIWPAHLFFVVLLSWYWFMVVRHSSRHVAVDDDGLWIDGERQVRSRDLVAVALVHDPFSTLHLKRVDPAARGTGTVGYWFGRDAWFHRSWVRVLEVEGVGRVAVPRSNDLARAAGWHAVLVVSRRRHARRDLRDYRQGWLLASYREERLLEALFAIAPDLELAEHVPDVRGRVV